MPQNQPNLDRVIARFLETSRIHLNLNRPRALPEAKRQLATARTWLGWLWLAGLSGAAGAPPAMAASAIDTVRQAASQNQPHSENQMALAFSTIFRATP